MHATVSAQIKIMEEANRINRPKPCCNILSGLPFLRTMLPLMVTVPEKRYQVAGGIAAKIIPLAILKTLFLLICILAVQSVAHSSILHMLKER